LDSRRFKIVIGTIRRYGDGHLERQVMGREVVIAVTEGQLDFGTWEQVSYGEFDGRRRERAPAKLIGE
jgi:thiamine phosphate synthase YjbQ (UPF0047 family)